MAKMIKKMAGKPMKKAQDGIAMSGPKKKIKVPEKPKSKLDKNGLYPINSKEEKARRGGDEVDLDYLYMNATGKMPKKKMGGKVAKDGGSFPDLNKDGKITKADILKGRGVIAKKGAKMAKCKYGCN